MMTDKIETIRDLQERVAALESSLAELKNVLHLLHGSIKSLIDAGLADDSSVVYERYTKGLKTNRSVAVPSEIVAIFAHYNIRKNVPTKTIARSGLLSMGKAYGIASWDLQFLHDFLEVNKLMDIYENASNNADLLKKYPVISKLNQHI